MPPCTWPSSSMGFRGDPEIVHHGVAADRDTAGLRVDLQLADMAAVREGGGLGIVVVRGVQRARRDRLRQVEQVDPAVGGRPP